MAHKDRYLGTIETEIVGMQYHDAVARPGDPVHLEREPDNQYDGNAIRVENGEFAHVGYLPRRMARWLAPLIDSGKIRVDGAVPAYAEFRDGSLITTMPLHVSVYLCAKGKRLLRENATPRDVPSALHETVRSAFDASLHYPAPSVVRGVGETLALLGKGDILPETRLLLALFPARADALRKQHRAGALAACRKALSRVTIGPARHYQGLTLFPLRIDTVRGSRYLLLESALKTGTVRVEEISEEGSVPTLRVVNTGSLPVLVPEGAVLVGAKQNRTVNITVLIAAHSTLMLPVTCVEQGRWRYVSPEMQAACCAPPCVRARTVQSVQHNRARRGSREGDQHAVWAEVDALLGDIGAESPTASVTDAYTAVEAQLQEFRRRLILPNNAAGFLLTRGTTLLGMDLFDTPRTMATMWPRLSDACFLEAIREMHEAPRTKKREARAFVSRIVQGLEPVDNPAGEGIEYEIRATGVIGNALWYRDVLCHLSAFTAPDGPRV